MTSSTAPMTGRNPGPRPALSRVSGEPGVVRVRPGVDADAVHASLGDAQQPDSPKAERPTKSKEKKQSQPGRAAELRERSKKSKHPKRSKADKPGKKGNVEPEGDAHELTVTLPKALRKELSNAASQHGTTPERLVALVLSEWLDH